MSHAYAAAMLLACGCSRASFTDVHFIVCVLVELCLVHRGQVLICALRLSLRSKSDCALREDGACADVAADLSDLHSNFTHQTYLANFNRVRFGSSESIGHMELDTVLSQLQSMWHEVVMTLAVSFWVGNILAQTFASVVALLYLPRWWAVAILLMQVSMHMRF